MPQENRKRGKRHKKQPTEEYFQEHAEAEAINEQPSWIRPSTNTDLDAPFGYVAPDLKAYFRTVEEKLLEWQDVQFNPEVVEEANEDRRMFLEAALEEMSGKERELATDPDCSKIIERMIFSMDEYIKRIFVDRLAGSYEKLVKHRFASHVVQTLLEECSFSVSKEAEGKETFVEQSSSEGGHLRSSTELVLAICDELLPSVADLITDAFASHVLRALLALLYPRISPLDGSGSQNSSNFRSKKSAKFRAKQGPMKSVFTHSEQDKEIPGRSTPELTNMARELLLRLRKDLNANEIRALATNKVACPTLSMFLQLEAYEDLSEENGSLMDHISDELVTTCNQQPGPPSRSSDYLTTLLREPTASHILENILLLAPSKIFRVIWEQEFMGKLNKLAIHPVANFVVARAIARLSSEQFLSMVEEMSSVWPKVIKAGRSGVLKASIERASQLMQYGDKVVDAIKSAFGLSDISNPKAPIYCFLTLKSFPDYQQSARNANTLTDQVANGEVMQLTETSAQGAALLQCLLQQREPYNEIVVDSIMSLSADEILVLARNTVGSRVLDTFLELDNVPRRVKRRFILSLIGHYHLLVDDKIGSHVGDRCWLASDPYLREKIARSLIPHEQFLVASAYGKYFSRKLQLHLLQRKPDAWKALQSNDLVGSMNPEEPAYVKEKDATGSPNTSIRREKRKREAPEDEIDALFDATLGKGSRKAQLVNTAENLSDMDAKKIRTGELESVLGAIRAAPKDIRSSKKKR